MNKLVHWENVILLLSAILLLPIWLSQFRDIPIFGGIVGKVLQVFDGIVGKVLQGILVIVLVVILVHRLYRIRAAMRESKNRQGPFPF